MIIMVTQWIPYDKTEQWVKIFLKEVTGPLPPYIKKWRSYATPDGDLGMKGYNLVYVEKGKGDEAQIYITKAFMPFWEIEGFSMKIEELLGMKDIFKVLGKSR
jgi:hypothetical protein